MYCYDELSVAIHESLRFALFSPEVPVLVYYSHLTAIIVSVVLSLFIILNNRTLPAKILAILALVFTTLALLDILLWTLIDVSWLKFLWSFWLFLFITIYVLSLYFLYTFIYKKDIGFVWKLGGVALLLTTFFVSTSAYNLQAFDVGNCTAVEGIEVLNTVFGISIALFVSAVVMGVRHILSLTDRKEKGRTLFATLGVALFLLSFSAAAYLASITNLLGASPDTFTLEQYGYFGMTIFIGLLTYVIVQYRAFNIRLIAAQALVVSLVILIAAQFLFIRNPVNYSLNAVALMLSMGFGYLLVKSVKREIEQRHQVEQLAKELEKSNRQQVTLIHFITHQLKGFMAKSRNIFSMIKEGDYGVVPGAMSPIIEEGLRSSTKGSQTIDEILNASNIKSGKVTYAKEPVDLHVLVGGLVADQKPNAEAKGVALTYTAEGEGFTITGDRMQLTNAFKNMIDNAVKYTMQGSVTVTLTRAKGCIRFSVADTGVGITPEDMRILFTEGGHGAESRKVNVDSTGFGLYIVKNIIDAHQGKVWGESEGAGKGSTFIVELPVS